MPLFRYVATDPAGLFREGTVAAPDDAAARDALAADGLRPREVEEVDPADDEEPVVAEFAPEPAPRPPARARPARRWGTTVLAVGAVLLALAAAGYSAYRDPPLGRLGRYDFRTPEAALRSDARMRADGDLLARAELDARFRRKALREQLDSLTVDRFSEHDGRTALFVRWTTTVPAAGGPREVRSVDWFARDERTGYWVPTRPPPGLARVNRQLAAQIAAWEARPTPD